eukprot:g5158.t1
MTPRFVLATATVLCCLMVTSAEMPKIIFQTPEQSAANAVAISWDGSSLTIPQHTDLLADLEKRVSTLEQHILNTPLHHHGFGAHTCANGKVQKNPNECVCDTGYRGGGAWNAGSETYPDCVEIDECAELSPCENDGTCTDKVADYHCTCAAGFRGKNCEENIDECAPGPCKNGATCTDGVNDFHCTCKAGYDGKDCSNNIDECASDPCVRGSCADGIADFTCTCPAGYDGKTCSNNINECAKNPCVNGQCVDGIADFTCTCLAGYDGKTCSNNINECASNPCVRGTCTDGVNDFTCTCPAGYDGKTCSNNIDECEGNPCQNGGTCADMVNAFHCTCTAGYEGARCETEIDECARDAPCKNDAVCSDKVNDYRCHCKDGYDGKDCENNINECAKDPCVNGKCVDGVNDYSCTCDPGFSGKNCDVDIDECASKPCANGKCTDLVNDFHCECDRKDGNGYVGWEGKRCDRKIACKNGAPMFPCNGNGNVGGFVLDGCTCDCNHGFTGSTCGARTQCTDNSFCSNNGQVSGYVLDGCQCQCSDGWTGARCDTPVVGKLPAGKVGCNAYWCKGGTNGCPSGNNYNACYQSFGGASCGGLSPSYSSCSCPAGYTLSNADWSGRATKLPMSYGDRRDWYAECVPVPPPPKFDPTSMYNNKAACGGDVNNCASRKCYTVSLVEGASTTPVVNEMHTSQPEWNAQTVNDWKAYRPDDFTPAAFHPGPAMTTTSAEPQQPLLLSLKDPNDGSGNVFLRNCEYMYGKPEWGNMGRFFLASACAKTEDRWEADTCSAAPTAGASTYVGFYWANKDMRTGAVSEKKNRLTWTMFEVAPSTFKFKNVMRQQWLGRNPNGPNRQLVLTERFADAVALKLDEAADPKVEHPTPTPSTCCTAAGCDCAISKVPGFGDNAARDDYSSSSRTRNDSEETTAIWTWDGTAWLPQAEQIVQSESEGGVITDFWFQGPGSISGSSSTIELGYSYDCQYVYNNDDDECYLADAKTKSSTTGQDNDLRMLKTVGLRFTGLNIAKGTKVKSAKIRFTARRSDNKPVSMVIRGDQASNAPTASFKGDYEEVPNPTHDYLRWRPISTNVIAKRCAATTYPAVAWDNIEPWAENQAYDTPDMTNLVQAMIDGNEFTDTLAFFLKDSGSTEVGARRRAKSFKRSGPAALVIEFMPAAPPAAIGKLPAGKVGCNAYWCKGGTNGCPSGNNYNACYQSFGGASCGGLSPSYSSCSCPAGYTLSNADWSGRATKLPMSYGDRRDWYAECLKN